MALPLPYTPEVGIARLTKALYNAAPGYTYMTAFLSASGPDTDTDYAPNAGMYSFANWLAAQVSTSAATLVTTVVTNLGLTGDAATAGTAYLTAQFAANPGNYGRVILNAMNGLAGLTSDATYGAAASAFNDSIATSYAYSMNSANTTTNLVTLQAADEPAAAGVGQTFTLTAGIDSVTGTSGNDTINANYDIVNAMATFSALDSIDGGAGTDTLNILSTATIADTPTATVKNVEIANLTSAGTVTTDASGWTGLTTLKSTGVGAATLTAAATTDVTVSTSTQAAGAVAVTGGNGVTVSASGTNAAGGTVTVTNAAGAISVTSNGSYVDGADHAIGAITTTGGTTASITQSAYTAAQGTTAKTDANNFTVTQGAVSVTGGTSTSAVTVTQSKAAIAVNSTGTDGVIGVVNGAVTIADAKAASATAAGTLATVTLNNFGAATIDSSALTTVNLSGTGTSLGIGRGALTATPTANTLALNVDSLTTTGAVTDSEAAADDGFQTLNITTAGTKSTIATLAAVDVKTMTVAGTAVLAVTNAITSMDALTTVTVSGGAGLTANISGEATLTTVTSTSTGNNTLTLANTATTVTGGSGADSVTFTGALGATAKVDLGAGNDTLKIAAASTALASVVGGDGTDTIASVDGAYFNGTVLYSGFETLEIGGGTGTYDVDKVGTSINAVTLTSTALVGNASITNAAAGTTLTVKAAGHINTPTTSDLSYALKTATGTTDTLTVSLVAYDDDKNAAGAGDVDGQVTVTKLTANSIETFAISSSATTTDGGAAATDTLMPEGSYKNTISSLLGDAVKTLTLTGAADLQITDVTATTLTKVDASAMTGQLTINLDASATAAVAVLGGSAADTITMTGNLAANNIIVGNGGADAITLAGAGTKETVRYAADGDSVLTLTDTTTPVVTPVVMDTATGYDVITNFTTTEDKIELSSALGLGTGDARTAITGKGTISFGATVDMTNAELAGVLQTLIGGGAGFFNDGTTNRAVAQVLVDETTNDDAILFIDVNADGNFTNGVDGAIYLVGAATGVVITDIQFG